MPKANLEGRDIILEKRVSRNIQPPVVDYLVQHYGDTDAFWWNIDHLVSSASKEMINDFEV